MSNTSLALKDTDLIHGFEEKKWREMAREIAMDILDRNIILQNHNITDLEWERIASHPRFQAMLSEERILWGSPLNTRERIEIKTQSMVENGLNTMWKYLHDPTFNDAAKVALWQSLQKGAKVVGTTETSDVGQKVQININMSSGKSIQLETGLPPRTIDGDAKDITNE